MRFTAHGDRTQQVGDGIAHHRHTVQVDAVALTNLFQQTGFRFAAMTRRVGCMRTIEHGINARSHIGQQAMHLGVHGVERGDVKQAAPQTGLVRCDHHMPAAMVEPRNRFQRTRQGRPFFRRLDIVGTVFVDGAVAVQNDELHFLLAQLASLERSATRFMASCKRLSSP